MAEGSRVLRKLSMVCMCVGEAALGVRFMELCGRVSRVTRKRQGTGREDRSKGTA